MACNGITRNCGANTVNIDGANVTITTADWTASTTHRFRLGQLPWHSDGSMFGSGFVRPHTTSFSGAPTLKQRQLANRIDAYASTLPAGGQQRTTLGLLAKQLRTGVPQQVR